MMYQSFITAAMFNGFVRDQVLPHCGSYVAGETLSVIICDNASVHHNMELAVRCEQAGVRLEYLSPYSPNSNTIETSSSVPKAWIKRRHDIAEVFAEDGDFAGFLDMAVRAQSGVGDPGNIFRKANPSRCSRGRRWRWSHLVSGGTRKEVFEVNCEILLLLYIPIF